MEIIGTSKSIEEAELGNALLEIGTGTVVGSVRPVRPTHSRIFKQRFSAHGPGASLVVLDGMFNGRKGRKRSWNARKVVPRLQNLMP